ncbi:spore cortex protein CoxA [Bacillus aquiflavi]|uniref:Spore cortex protein CoxA n=1 Tax=Bacillus aquiflavi TaxID=2672567 RepID=A0A6B3VYT7_9BACI|nr:spore cortex protein CoxA [Bacillus aquiflavi]MBA4537177.1 spore cortex protein CoxA [Bacillus aquiflavi]NEY81435.1 spore cortex protein CoxA [Bacillus aquiflavi]UAC47397.1 spore cortex protein CoxA [Bacillus aquiflavi]
MRKWCYSFSLTALVASSLAGCNMNDETAVQDERYTDQTQPIGYYSNENHQQNNSNFFNDNDGPVIDMLDRTLGEDGNNSRTNIRNNLNWFKRDHHYSHADANYHGHLNVDRTKHENAHVRELVNQIEKVTAETDNVKDIHSIAYGDEKVLISVVLFDQAKEKETKKKIKQRVNPFLNGKSIKVVIDEGTLTNTRNSQR